MNIKTRRPAQQGDLGIVEKNADVIPTPRLGLSVLVKTTKPINGQFEHAAIITQVGSANMINVMLLPPMGDAYPVSLVLHESIAHKNAMSWRWPPTQ